QVVAVAQAIARSWAEPPYGFVLLTIDHAPPVQRAASGLALSVAPTAMQSVGLMHAIASSPPAVPRTPDGLGRIFHGDGGPTVAGNVSAENAPVPLPLMAATRNR